MDKLFLARSRRQVHVTVAKVRNCGVEKPLQVAFATRRPVYGVHAVVLPRLIE
ncbi:hypothetical protein PQR02_01585 [Paraburkholderia sediminicola]|uniref:Uncharacterized protein n=1 Tax=Paraburkholderia rhynchosiae TaxID=487049 RepID=A0ACC7N666_9BURK